MHKRILAAGGSLLRQSDSRWAVFIMWTPDDGGFTDTIIVTGFFRADQRETAHQVAWSTKANFCCNGSLLDLTRPEIDKFFSKQVHCKLCGDPLFRGPNGQWQSTDQNVPQYCWVDPQHGSQLHKVGDE